MSCFLLLTIVSPIHVILSFALSKLFERGYISWCIVDNKFDVLVFGRISFYPPLWRLFYILCVFLHILNFTVNNVISRSLLILIHFLLGDFCCGTFELDHSLTSLVRLRRNLPRSIDDFIYIKLLQFLLVIHEDIDIVELINFRSFLSLVPLRVPARYFIT